MSEVAIARGETPRASDVDVLMDMLYGPTYHRLLQGHLPLTPDFAKRVVSAVVAGAKVGGAVPSSIRQA
ncbi:MAG TPA: TetR-like C-terminal domain-containing protein [Acidimicrobiales bacterium]|nr:TetR-like C-terminal domain-containing protein [Acidimicrobiales bacterium]